MTYRIINPMDEAKREFNRLGGSAMDAETARYHILATQMKDYLEATDRALMGLLSDHIKTLEV